MVTGSERRGWWLLLSDAKSFLQIIPQRKIGQRSFGIGILPVTSFPKAVMQDLVPFLQRGLIESRFTKVTLVRLDSRVDILVLLQMRRSFKVTVAVGALIRLLPRVTAFMPRFVRSSSKPFVAKFTFIRFYFRVTALVLTQIGVLTKGRRTILAPKRFFPGMSSFVLLQMRLTCKVGLAILALVLAFLAMGSHVQLLLLEILKRARAMRTLVKRDSRVHFFVLPQHI